MQSPSRPSYLPWVDLTRIIAILFVIIVHVSYRLINEWGRIPFDWWMVGNVVEGLSRTAVSLYIMVSGYLNLSHPLPMKEYFQRRIPRVLILLVTWSLIHMILLVVVGQGEYTFLSTFRAILTGDVYLHLWFLYALFGFYLITPVFQKIVETDRNIIWYFLILWIVFEPLAFLFERFADLEFGILLPQATGYFGYYLLGYLLATREFTKKQVWLGLGAYILATLFIIFTTWGMTASSGKPDTTFYDINGFPVIIGAVGLFIVIKTFNVDSPALRFFGKTTTGIYLMHYIVLEFVKRGILGVKLTATSPINPYLGVPLATLAIFLISALITWIFLQIPVLKKIVS
ncbi:MAG: acyltransferase family protein [Chloroflexi bacterium]|nr:acyltransferase family protein [Chloroflexota bacterium]